MHFSTHNLTFALVRFFKKIAIYFFIAGVIFPSETAHALTFIPDFISHYYHHNEVHHQISLVDFIYEHTANDKDHEGQDEKKSCPIHHNHETAIQSPYVPRTNDFEIYVASVNEMTMRKNVFPTLIFNTSEIHFEIWQPPRVS